MPIAKLLSYVRAEICDIAYVLPLNGGHMNVHVHGHAYGIGNICVSGLTVTCIKILLTYLLMFDLLVTLLSESIHTSPTVLTEPRQCGGYRWISVADN